jgi:hypothetical protein
MLLNRLIQENDPRAVTLWHSLAKRHWIAADERSPYNAKFLREPLNVAFDWRFPVHDGVVQLRGPAGLEIELNGREPENCILAEQVIAIAAGAYEFNCDYRGDGMLADSGVQWQAVDSRTGVVLGVSRNLAATDSGTVAFRFTAPDSPGFVRLRLTYQRSPGTSRIAGRLALLSTQLRAY